MTWQKGVKHTAKRNSLLLTSVKDLKIDDFTTRTTGPDQPAAAVSLQNIQQAAIRLPILTDLGTKYIRVEGPHTRDVTLQLPGEEKQSTKYVVAPNLKNQVTIN